MELQIIKHELDKKIILQLKGRLGMLEAPTLAQYMQTLVFTNAKKLIVDCSDVYLIDSSGIGEFINILDITRKKYVEFIIVGLSKEIGAVMQLAKLDKILKYYNKAEYYEEQNIIL
jgi:anti-anti-sigma factor